MYLPSLYKGICSRTYVIVSLECDLKKYQMEYEKR
jgi:hypothetical protein